MKAEDSDGNKSKSTKFLNYFHNGDTSKPSLKNLIDCLSITICLINYLKHKKNVLLIINMERLCCNKNNLIEMSKAVQN
jgi:hypothetical protein